MDDRQIEEQGLATLVQRQKVKLLELLTEEEARCPRGVKGQMGPQPTFEDSAIAIAESQDDERAPKVRSALFAFQQAVNGLWLFMINSGVTKRIVSFWRKSRKSKAKKVPSEDLYAEADFTMRRLIIAYDPEKTRKRIDRYAQPAIFRALDDLVTRSSSPVELPRDVRRANGNAERRAPLATEE